MDRLRFECLRSGQCCTHLVNEAEAFGVTNGLLLLDIEKNLFPEHLVKPQWGVGSPKGNGPERVVSYQLTENICPFYHKDEGCKIHDRRPLICRAFPVLLLSWEKGNVGWSGNCTWIKEHFGKERISNVEAPAELSAVETLGSILMMEARTGSSLENYFYWNYDLKSDKWKLLGSPF